jgi:hypothetical protein
MLSDALQLTNHAIAAAGKYVVIWPVAASLLLISCADPVKPFRTPLKSTVAASSVPASPRAALRIRNISEFPESGDENLFLQYVALALQDQGFTASRAGGFQGSYLLDGQIRLPRQYGAVMMVRGRWQLFFPDERLYFEAVSSTRLTIADFFLNKDIGYARIARDAARAIDSRLYLFEAGKARRPTLPSVTVGRISGAPGRGNQYLTAAIIAALAQEGVPLAASADADSLELGATVSRIENKESAAQIRVVWTVIRPDGTEIGRIVQIEPLSADPASHSWQAKAGRISASARGKIVDLLQGLAATGTD